MLESKPFNYSMEDIRFGDENAKAEKAKQSFLNLKQKICRTSDVIQQYSNKVKECDYLKGEVENAKKETEEWKKQHFDSLAKILEMKTARAALEKTKKSLTRENAELEIKIAGDQKHLQQLMCKLGDIEDQHSEKLMEVDLEKSGLQSKIAELEKEIKVLHKVYKIKTEDTTTKNADKPKKGKKLRSPMKTTRSTGLLPELDDGTCSNVEINSAQMSGVQHSPSMSTILTTEIEKKPPTVDSDPPKLFSVAAPGGTIITPPETDAAKQIPTPKPITSEKNIMTDEFYGKKDNVYPLLCDKCEVSLESMPTDKIFKIMTTIPPLLSTVPPSPKRITRVDQEIQTINIPIETNISVQDDSNVSSVLDKVQQTLETLEKQMRRNDEKHRCDQDTAPHCSHNVPSKCCNHNYDSTNNQNLSQMNMMASFWSSMMKFATSRTPKPRIKLRKPLHLKPKHRKGMKKKLKTSLNSWLVESDTSSLTDAANPTSNEISYVVAPDYSEEEVNQTKRRKRRNSLNKMSETSSQVDLRNSDAKFQTCPDSPPHISDIRSSIHNREDINSFINPTTSTPTSSDFVVPTQIIDENAQNPSVVPDHFSIETDSTSLTKKYSVNSDRSTRKHNGGLESDTSDVTDLNSMSSTPTNTHRVAAISINSTAKIDETHEDKILDHPHNEPETSSELVSRNLKINLKIHPNISPHIGRAVSPVHHVEVLNPTENVDSNFSKPEKIERNIRQSLINDTLHTLAKVDPMSRIRNQQVKNTGPALNDRTGLLQKLRRLRKDTKPVGVSRIADKVIDQSDQTDAVENLAVGNIPEGKKRIAHVCKRIDEEDGKISNDEKTEGTRSMIRSGEMPLSMSSKSIVDKCTDSLTNTEQSYQKMKTEKLSNDTVDHQSSESHSYNHDDAADITDKTDDSNESTVVDKILNSIPEIANTSERIVEHKHHADIPVTDNLGMNTKKDESKKIISNIPISCLHENSLDTGTSSLTRNGVTHVKVEKYAEETDNNRIIVDGGDDSDRLLGKKDIGCVRKNKENQSEHQINVANDQVCKVRTQVMHSSVDSSTMNIMTTTDDASAFSELDGTRNARSFSTKLSNSSSDVSVELLRKRQRIDSVTQPSCKETTGSSSPTLDELFTESDLISPKTRKRRSVPEIIQNEIGRFFNTKRIVTRSMKKSEESLSPNIDQSQKIDITPLKRLGSPRMSRKIATPAKSATSTPIDISRKFVKSLFSTRKCGKKNLNSNDDNNSNQPIQIPMDKEKIVNSTTTVPDTHCTNTNNETGTSPLRESTVSPIDNNMEVDQNDEMQHPIIRRHFNNGSKKIKSSISELFGDDDSGENNTENSANSLENSLCKIDSEENILVTSPTLETDSPLSPDPTPTKPTVHHAAPSTNIPLELEPIAEIDDPYPDAVREKTPIYAPPSTNLVTNYDSPVRELRNRKVPITPQSIPKTLKNNKTALCMNGDAERSITNIKSLLDIHFSLMNKTGSKTIKFQDLAARRATDELIDKLREELMRFINSPNWDTCIYQSVVDNLSKVASTKTITRAILNLIVDPSALKEVVDTSHTPPAPPMTQTQQKVIVLVQKLNEVKPDLILLIFRAINHQLFRLNRFMEVEKIKSLAKIYVVLSKIKKDRQRVRTLICDAMYNLQSRSLIIVHTVLTSWPEVLPIYDQNQSDSLSYCIVHMIQHQSTHFTELTHMKRQLQNLIKNYYKYPDSNPLSVVIVDKLLNELTTPNYDRRIITSLLLLAKKEGTGWTYENIIKEKLLRIIIENKNSSAYNALILLGYLLKCFPKQDDDGSVKNIVDQLCAILNAGSMPTDIQEGAIMALISLSQRHSRYSKILKSILMWRPPRPLSPVLQSQLELLFKSRSCQEWQRVKI